MSFGDLQQQGCEGMLDAKCAQMLKTIQRECGDGSFKIFTNEDLCANFPKFEEPPAPEVVAEMVHFLEEREFIQVKYRDETSYCLTVLSKGRLYEENETERRKEKRSFKKFVFVSFGSGFLGALAGVLLAAILLHLL